MRALLAAILLTTTLLSGSACAQAGGGAGVEGRAEAKADASQGSAASQPNSPAAPPDLGSYFKERRGTFVLYDLRNDRYLRHDAARAAERFTPFSTFKIPNSLIGLETGVIEGADFEIKWDAEKYPRRGEAANFAAWWQDQTLRTAFQRSAVWYYQELASRAGEKRMKEMLDRLGYGNKDTSGGLTRFWLGSTLKISADEQVEFLKALHAGRLPVSARSAAIVKEIMTLEQTPDYRLSGKTGGGPLAEGRYLGWFVGYLETKENTHFFAMQLEGPTFASIRDERIRLTKQILSDLKLMKEEKK